jgi:hypothetical protein
MSSDEEQTGWYGYEADEEQTGWYGGSDDG